MPVSETLVKTAKKNQNKIKKKVMMLVSGTSMTHQLNLLLPRLRSLNLQKKKAMRMDLATLAMIKIMMTTLKMMMTLEILTILLKLQLLLRLKLKSLLKKKVQKKILEISTSNHQPSRSHNQLQQMLLSWKSRIWTKLTHLMMSIQTKELWPRSFNRLSLTFLI